MITGHQSPITAPVNLLSIQSWVAYGHVGNAASLFPLQRLGAEVWAVNTVQFSNHPGYGAFAGEVFTGDTVRRLVNGIAELGALPSCAGILSGYLGEPGIGEAVRDAVARVRDANPAALYCCDPVIGDAGRIYVRPGIPELIATELLPQADILTPNQFELEYLAGRPLRAKPAVLDALAELRARMRPAGPRAVLVTSLRTDETPETSLDMVAADAEGSFLLRTPLLPITANGAGDALAALFLFHYLKTGSAAAALSAAGSAIYAVLRRTAELGRREMALVAAQDELIAPSQVFAVESF